MGGWGDMGGHVLRETTSRGLCAHQGDCVKEGGGEKGRVAGSARGSVHWSDYDATALEIEVDPQRCHFGSCKSDLALQALVE